MHILLIGSACKIGEELIHALEGRHHNVCVSHASQPDVLYTNYDTLRTFDTIIYLVNEDALPLGTLQGEKRDIHRLQLTHIARIAHDLSQKVVVVYQGSELEQAFQNTDFHTYRVPRSILKIHGKSQRSQQPNRVHSIQHLNAPVEMDRFYMMKRYFQYLSRVTLGLVDVSMEDTSVTLRLKGFNVDLIRMDIKPKHTFQQVLTISGGRLVSQSCVGKASFRFYKVVGQRAAYTALIDFEPQLPWWLYRFTQFPLHGIVMWGFKYDLKFFRI
ncbi:hypothetical protein [Staphylococcus auricularis]|uniref:hypothetical protein n=1 Tax=Staphylococcus auricularis TaxID=29379 RepID=UPI001F199FBE|nr:hypothetical protein [Staphylococcus auricularis]MCE5038528.1 hypothetical protein [Staphylococcus auricularis]